MNLESGVIVVLELAANRERKTLGQQGDVILDKKTEKLITTIVVVKLHRFSGIEIPARQAIAKSPQQLLTAPQAEPVLEVHVNGIPRLAKDMVLPFGSIIVDLKRQIGG